MGFKPRNLCESDKIAPSLSLYYSIVPLTASSQMSSKMALIVLADNFLPAFWPSSLTTEPCSRSSSPSSVPAIRQPHPRIGIDGQLIAPKAIN